MLFNYSSLMLAVAFSGAALSATLFASWCSWRSENFLLTWAVGAIFIVLSAWGFSLYTLAPSLELALGFATCLTLGLSLAHAAAWQFRAHTLPLLRTFLVTTVLLVPMNAAFLLGYDGIGTILANLNAAVLLFATSADYWKARHEAPLPIYGLTGLYGITGVSFALCAAMISVTNPLVLHAPPQGWAENLNAIVALISMTSIGALSLALHQFRLARRHRSDAHTDALTGLLNRRALFERYSELGEKTGVVLFDLDHFKQVNDVHGHAVGDKVLRQFSKVLRDNLRPTDAAARLGGEEFVLVVNQDNPGIAFLMAEVVRTSFAAQEMTAAGERLYCTVSAGVATVKDGETLDMVLRRADRALYLAKREGRNSARLAGDGATSADVVPLSARSLRTGAF
jgi:diguanylate cyclase (GGDEF)-like protein